MSDEDVQQGIVLVVVVAFVEKTPPYPEGKQLIVCSFEFSWGLRNTPSYGTKVQVLVDADDAAPLLDGTPDDAHGVQETINGSNAKTPLCLPPYIVVVPKLSEDVIKEGSAEVIDVVSCLGPGIKGFECWIPCSCLPKSK